MDDYMEKWDEKMFEARYWQAERRRLWDLQKELTELANQAGERCRAAYEEAKVLLYGPVEEV